MSIGGQASIRTLNRNNFPLFIAGKQSRTHPPHHQRPHALLVKKAHLGFGRVDVNVYIHRVYFQKQDAGGIARMFKHAGISAFERA